MKEDLLHYIWKTRGYQSLGLSTTNDERLTILNVGQANVNAGPDFLNARIMVDDTLWAGNVEIHVSASDWRRHNHDGDPLYKNVILHVVYNYDEDVMINGNNLPVLELNGKVPPRLFERYERMMYQSDVIKCGHYAKDVPLITWTQVKERKILERLDRKKAEIESTLNNTGGDWEKCGLVLLARCFGGTVNRENFERLLHRIPINLVRKYRHDELKLAALFFGCGNLLEDIFFEEYPIALKKEFQLLKHLHQLDNRPYLNWRFSKMRPAAFPTVRLAQFVSLLYQQFPLVHKYIESFDVTLLFDGIEAPEFWSTHYRFGNETKYKIKRLGNAFQRHLLINVVVPFMYSYGFHYGNMEFVHRSLKMLRSIDSESNKVTRRWKSVGIESENAEDSQALIQLYNEDCAQLNCLSCPIGHQVLKRDSLSIVEESFEYIA